MIHLHVCHSQQDPGTIMVVEMPSEIDVVIDPFAIRELHCEVDCGAVIVNAIVHQKDGATVTTGVYMEIDVFQLLVRRAIWEQELRAALANSDDDPDGSF